MIKYIYKYIINILYPTYRIDSFLNSFKVVLPV